MGLEQFYPGLNEGFKLPLKNLEGAGLATYGNVFYVDSVTGSNSANNGSSFNNALAGIDTAIGFCTANKGDTIIVRQGHTETVTTAIAADIAGIRIIGLGQGNQRPVITGNGAIDAINVSAAGVVIENLRFAAPGTDDQTADINVAAAGCVIRNTHHIGSTTSKNKTDIITLTSAADYALIEGVEMYNTVVDVVAGISVEGALTGATIRGCVIQGTYSTSCIMDEATALLLTIKFNTLKNTKTTGSCMTFTTGNSTGVASFNHCSGRDTTIANNVVAGTGMDFFENRVTEQAALNGMIMPAADAE
jgi:hypothetical protein